MDDLNKYYKILFDKAHHLDTIHFCIEIIFVGLVIGSNFISGYFLYAVGIVGIGTQIAAFVVRKQQQIAESTAHKLQAFALLYSHYKGNTFNFEVSQIKGEVSLDVHNKVKKLLDDPESTKYTADEGDKNALIQMLQENCFWNKHQYGVSYESSLRKVIFWVAGILIAILLSIGTTLITPDMLYTRILLIFLSLNLFWNEIDKILLWYNASKAMLALDNSIEKQKAFGEDFLIHTFTSYHITKSTAPIIKEKLYKKYGAKLNDAWKSRFNQLYVNNPIKDEA